jgi:AAHS family 3-hydroxyphenylpropionic acid transporter
MPNLIAIATEISPPERRAATTTSMFCGLPAGGSLVALLAGYGGPLGEWRMIFLLGGLAPLLLTPIVILLMPETRPQAAQDSDRRILSGLFAEGRAMATLLIWVIFALDLLITYLLLNWLPTLVVAKGFAPHQGATAALWLNGASVVGALILGRIADRVGYRWPLTAIFAGLAVAVWALAQASGIGGLFAASAATGFLVVGGLYVLYALAPAYYPPQVRAAGAGTAIAVGRLGSIAGPLIAGELRAVGYTPSEVFMAMLPAAGLTAAAVFALTSFRRTYRED